MSYYLSELENHGGFAVIRAGGELDLYAAPELRAAVEQALEEDCSQLVIDLAEVTFIDSTSIGVLMIGHRALSRSGGALQIVALNRNVVTTLHIVGLDRELHIRPSLDEALHTVASPA